MAEVHPITPKKGYIFTIKSSAKLIHHQVIIPSLPQRIYRLFFEVQITEDVLQAPQERGKFGDTGVLTA